MRKKIAIVGLMLILGLAKLVMAQVWERIIPSGNPPDKRNGHVLISPGGSEQFVFGGFDQDDDLWMLRREGGGIWRWENMDDRGDTPGTRGGHSGIFFYGDGDNSIIIFGGSESSLGVPSDIVTYRLENPWDPDSTWEKFSTEGSTPSARAEHTAVYDYSNKMIVFGGYTIAGVVVSSETYTLDFSTSPASWAKLSTTGEIPARYGHSAVWANWRMVVFGGKDGSGELLNDSRELNLGTTNWSKIPVTGDKPPARWQHTAVWIPGEFPGGMLIFGGQGENEEYLDDLWFLQEPDFGAGESNWKWEKLYPIGDLPSARSGHAAALGQGWEGQQMFIFGGSGKSGDLNDVYVLSEGGEVEKILIREGPFNAPNPFNPDREETKICYYLEDDENVKIKLFTLTGDLVYSWENISGRKGLNQWPWNGKNEKGRVVENGGYICLIEAGGKKQKCKIAVLR